MTPQIFLASQSPRRAELLRQMGVPFQIISSPYVEDAAGGLTVEAPSEWALRQARGKLEAVRGALPEGGIAICADTVVTLDGRIMGKPEDEGRAAEMLAALSGRTHSVLTAVCIGGAKGPATHEFVESTEVTFLPISQREIEAYVATGEPMDKAGAYAIQGFASVFISGISGDYFNVVGLPLAGTAQRLKQLGADASRFWRKPQADA